MNALAPVNSARLPQTYEAARAALAQCSAVDECNDWADKAAALASYARQSQDDQLERMAQRIRARAIRRAGELLKQIEPAPTGPKPELKAGDRLQLGRADAAREAGMSPHQAKQAVRVANVSEDDFEEQVESPNPPTLSQLASQGTQKRQPEPPRPIIDLKGRDPREFNRALHFIGAFEDYARALVKENIEAVTAILTPEERLRLRGCINKIDAVHDRIMTRI
ncbi:MAG: hypothetical protein ABNH17_05415 [Paracoccus sp. (in: a-proteobacteria)]|jgi:hypothetical protein|uniref:hypothetical protein n=1 Tax=Paracoccus sp. TaxID=267 RepID=UPI0032D92A82